MQRLPIGIQTFAEIINNDYLYIDKTDIALDLIQNNKYAFLSRPRRFGKSLFIDTLQNIFEGNKELFGGLAIEDRWDFDDIYPVIKIDWAGDFKTMKSTRDTAIKILADNQERLGVECIEGDSPANCFRDLIKKSYQKYQKPVVILIDEYDKPILDNIEDTDRALENRDFLRSFYVMMKEYDAYIKFAFLTGISKFSKASIFSGLNNIEDISLSPRYATICGYTQHDLESRFEPYLVDADMDRVKDWYNGYNFLGDKVYNPFDILKFIKNDCIFKNYWWTSGNPYFLITLLKQQNYSIPNLEHITVGEELLSTFEIEKLRLEVLLFQSGYLTIDKVSELPFGGYEYTLKVPNMEVSMSLNNLFLEYLVDGAVTESKKSIYLSLLAGELDEFRDAFTSLFASIPYNNYVKNNIGDYEGYYASVFYAYLAASGLHIIAEDVTNSGRIDLTIILKDKVYILEFKVDGDDALTQIRDRGYANKYLSDDREIYLVGINFDKESRNISGFEWEKNSTPNHRHTYGCD